MRLERLDEDDSSEVESIAMSQRAAAPGSRRDLTEDSDPPCITAGIQRYETRDRATYYEDLRAAVAADRRETAIHRVPDEPVDGRAQHQVPLPDSAQPEVADDPSRDDREALDTAVDTEVRLGCEHIRETECTVITPAMREIDAADRGRELVGLDHRLKGEERLQEKVAALLESQPGMTAEQALGSIPDAVRFTFCYADDRYTAGVQADVDRLHAWGFEMIKLKNTWASDQYKGINAGDRAAVRGPVPHGGQLRRQAVHPRRLRADP